LAGGGTLFKAAEGFAVAATRTIKLPARQPDRAARTATVEMRFGEVEICRPRDERDRSLAQTVRLRLVEVQEVDPPDGVEPLHWRLLTTHDVADAEKAWQIVGWYQARWVIEQLFRVTKSPAFAGACAGAATGGQPTRIRGSSAEADRDRDKGGLYRYPVGAGTRWQAPTACLDRLHGAGNRNPRSAGSDARRQDRAAEEPAPGSKPGPGLLGDRAIGRLELLL